MSTRVCVVTGGARGLGRAIASALAEGGARLALCDVLDEALEETAAELGPAVKNRLSHRGQALAELRRQLLPWLRF